MEIGKRYWLDSWKDCSGIFIGYKYVVENIEKDGFYFNEVEGRSPYLPYSGTNVIGFNRNMTKEETFYEV